MSSKVRHRVRIGALVAAALGATTALTACSEGGSGASGATAIPEAKAAITKVQPAATSYPGISPTKNPVSLKGKKIMIVPIADTIDILAGIASNAKAALEGMGATVKICDGKGNPTDVSNCLREAESEHVDAVATQFVPFGMEPNGYASLSNAGIKVVINGDAPEEGHTYPANVGFNISTDDLDMLSKLQGDAALADFGTDANVINLEQTQTANEIEQGETITKEINRLCPSCPVTTVKFVQSNASQLPSQVSAALVKNPKANVIEVAVDSFIPQVRQGISAAGRTAGLGPGHVEIISNGSDLAALQLIKSGVVAHDMGNSPVFDGYALADAIDKSLAGNPIPPAPPFTRDFVKSNVSDLSLTTAAYNTMAWFGNDSFKADYEKAWGGK